MIFYYFFVGIIFLTCSFFVLITAVDVAAAEGVVTVSSFDPIAELLTSVS